MSSARWFESIQDIAIGENNVWIECTGKLAILFFSLQVYDWNIEEIMRPDQIKSVEHLQLPIRPSSRVHNWRLDAHLMTSLASPSPRISGRVSCLLLPVMRYSPCHF